MPQIINKISINEVQNNIVNIEGDLIDYGYSLLKKENEYIYLKTKNNKAFVVVEKSQFKEFKKCLKENPYDIFEHDFIVGFLLAYDKAKGLQIGKLYVEQNHRGQNISTILYSCVQEYAIKNKIDFICSDECQTPAGSAFWLQNATHIISQKNNDMKRYIKREKEEWLNKNKSAQNYLFGIKIKL